MSKTESEMLDDARTSDFHPPSTDGCAFSLRIAYCAHFLMVRLWYSKEPDTTSDYTCMFEWN